MSTLTDPISDFLTRIRNGSAARLASIEIPYSKLKKNMAQMLLEEGYIAALDVESKDRPFSVLKLALKYHNKEPVIKNIGRVSRPGLRVYVAANKIPHVLSGLGICLLSTSKGVMTGRAAKKSGIGGELLATIW